MDKESLIDLYQRYFGPGTGFEEEEPSSCLFFGLFRSFERLGETSKAQDMRFLAAADNTVCGLRGCLECDLD